MHKVPRKMIGRALAVDEAAALLDRLKLPVTDFWGSDQETVRHYSGFTRIMFL